MKSFFASWYWRRGHYGIEESMARLLAFAIGANVGVLVIVSGWPPAILLMPFLGATVLFLFAPLVRVPPWRDPEQLRKTLPLLETIAQRVGFAWSSNYYCAVDALLQEGKTDDACKLLKQHGMTWDEADRCVAAWPFSLVEGSLRLMVEQKPAGGETGPSRLAS